MKYDNIIIGGGLSGLIAGLSLVKKQKKVAIISLGQSALHFSSGSFGLLGNVDGKAVEAPLDAIASLPAEHPYARLGADTMKALLAEVKPLFAEAGITLRGDAAKNEKRLTPMGEYRSCWLTLDDFVTEADLAKAKKVTVVNIKGFLDFYPDFVAEGLRKQGFDAKVETITIDDVERLRRSKAEMRATSIGRQIKGAAIDELARNINKVSGDADVVLMPAVVGFNSEEPMAELRKKVGKPLFCVATTPMSVAGTRMQMQLRRRFEALGGTYFLGDNVTEGEIDEKGRLRGLCTSNLGADCLEADSFILATGGFFGHGLVAEPHRIIEPVLGLDVHVTGDRDQWFVRDFFGEQPYMKFGLETDAEFRPSKDGKTVENLYAIGAVLGGYNALKEESGAGVAILTAMHVAKKLS